MDRTSKNCRRNDGESKEKLHFDDQSKQLLFSFFSFFFEEFLKRSREHVLGVPIELYKHYRKFQRV